MINNLRIGIGFDSHQIENGDAMTLGGIKISCNYKIIAHSDGDVVTHAICDACLLYTSPSPRDLSTSRMPSSA